MQPESDRKAHGLSQYDVCVVILARRSEVDVIKTEIQREIQLERFHFCPPDNSRAH
jgi:hypothetical protein